jgi:hypothetical protein
MVSDPDSSMYGQYLSHEEVIEVNSYFINESHNY